MMLRWLRKLFRRRRHTIRDPHSSNVVVLKRFDDTKPPKKDSIQTTLPVEDAGQSSLERWGAWE
tara:strand:+ start:557 stop:748 length:192 start_codon:yes stop_codon:yes gene_type:complete